MANKLKVQEREAIGNLSRLGWGIRRIARELGLSRNTVRGYARDLNGAVPAVLAEENVKRAAISLAGSPVQTDPLSTPGSSFPVSQTDPLSTAGNTGRKSLCADHAALILSKVEAGLTAQRIFQDLRIESSFAGSYQSVNRYVHRLRQTTPEVVQRIEVAPAEEVQVDFGAGPCLVGADGKRRKTWIFRVVLSYSRKASRPLELRFGAGNHEPPVGGARKVHLRHFELDSVAASPAPLLLFNGVWNLAVEAQRRTIQLSAKKNVIAAGDYPPKASLEIPAADSVLSVSSLRKGLLIIELQEIELQAYCPRQRCPGFSDVPPAVECCHVRCKA